MLKFLFSLLAGLLFLLGKLHIQRYAEIAVRCGICRRRHERRVHLVVEICSYGQALAHHIVGCEIERERACTAGGLCQAGLYFAYQCRVVVERAVEIERQVVADIALLAFQFEHGVEISYLISCTKLQRLLSCLHYLTCR